jgi:hypothetical protein
MFRRTSSQRSFFGAEFSLDPAKRARLERTWAEQFRRHALPLINEARFAKYFDAENGRPNKSIRLIFSLLVLKEVWDLTDDEALGQLEWNLAWHYALDVTTEEAHTCQKTLHNFRARLLEDDQGAGLFESTTASLIKAAGLRTERQRQDSTHIVSNIRLLTRLGLFVQTITKFLTTLRQEHPRLCAQVTDELLGRYLDREGYFADAKSSEAPRRLEQSAMDLCWLVTRFGEHKQVSAMESYQLVERLYADQCVPPPTATPEKIELQKEVSSGSLQSPSDPDLTYGHKGKGYEVQLAETCVPENPFQVVTAVEVNNANESDQQHVEPVLQQTERTCEQAPEVMFGDSGFASGDNILKAQEYGTELVTPIGTKESTKHLPVGAFEFDEQGERVLKCPRGEVPERQEATRTGKAVLAIFGASQCGGCPHREQCPTEERKAGRVLKFTRSDVAVARRRVEQETAAFKERYKIRSGMEATNSELKRCHGFRKLRVRRRPRVNLAVRLKVLALNIKRYFKHLTAVFRAHAGAAPCAC